MGTTLLSPRSYDCIVNQYNVIIANIIYHYSCGQSLIGLNYYLLPDMTLYNNKGIV